MINLTRSEMKRFWARRMTRVFPAVLGLLTVAGVVIAYMVIDASDNPTIDFVQDLGGSDARDTLGPFAILLPMMTFVIGASYIGADLKTGMVEQLLTWEPRRSRHVIARSISTFTGCFVLASALSVLLIALFYGLASALGTTSGMDGEYWGWLAMAVLRTGAAAGLLGVLGLGITWIANSSVGSIVGYLIYWFVVENFLLVAFLPKIAVWAPGINAASFSSARDVERIDGSAFGDFDVLVHHSYLTAGVVLVGWAALAIGVGTVVFQRRDIA